MSIQPAAIATQPKHLQNGIDIVFEDVEYTVQTQVKRDQFKLPCKKEFQDKQILKGISGIAKAGEITAIMGASGAGKTTLLNIVSCRIPFTSQENERKIGRAHV